MTIIVLGSNSFAGSCFVNYSLNKGKKIIGISRSIEKTKYEIQYKNNKKIKNFKFIKADINKNLSIIKNILEKNKKNIVVDFAGQGMVAQSWDNPEQWFKTNVLSKINLLEHLRKEKLIKKYIKISTPEVYGSHSDKIKETFIFNPSTPYALTHSTIDQFLIMQSKINSFPVSILRFSNFYGEFQPGYRIIPKTILSILKKKKLPLHGNGKSFRSFIYIDDFCSAIFKTINVSRTTGQVINISSKEEVSIISLIKIICDKMNYDIRKLLEIKIDRAAKDKKYLMSASKAKNLLNWTNKVSLDQGINKTINWFTKIHNSNIKINLEYKHKI